MATPLYLSTVIRFGSLEFMSLGYNYDMILLPLGTPFGSDFSPLHRRCGRHSGHHGHRSRRAHHARRVWGSPRPSSRTRGESPSSSESSCAVARVGSLTRDLSRIGSVTDEAPMAWDTTIKRHVKEPPCNTGPTSAVGGLVAAVSPFPYGLDNAAMIHSRSIRPTMGSCTGLPQYRLLTTFELSETMIETSSTGSSGDSDGWAGADSFGLCDSDGANYDPSRECFHVGSEETDPVDAALVGQSARALLQRTLPTGPLWERPAMSAPVGTHQAELEQLRELEAKVDEHRQQLVHRWATLEQWRSGRGDGRAARPRARDINRRINNDKGGDQPPVFARASQNVAAAAILLWTMPEPSTIEGRQVRNKLHVLLECAVVQQAESSPSR
jgi:hypothetical protein